MADCFVSYSHLDKEFGQALYTALKTKEYDVWMDWKEIQPTAHWWEEIKEGILLSDNFVFIMSANSIASPTCNLELEYARSQNKRIIPLLLCEFDAESAHVQLIHKQLNEFQQQLLAGRDLLAIARDNWVTFESVHWVKAGGDFEAMLAELNVALHIEIAYVHEHTWLLARARDWMQRGKLPSLLLRGDDLMRAEAWLREGQAKKPAPLAEHQDYIEASRADEDRQKHRAARMRMMTIVLTVVGFLAVAATIVAVYQAQRAITDAGNARATEIASNRLRETAVAARVQAEIEGTIVVRAAVTAGANVVNAHSTLASVEGSSTLAAQQLSSLFRVVGIVPVGLSPDGLAWDGSLLWVANGNDDSVMGIDPATGRLVRTFSVGNGPLNLLWDGSGLWVAHWLSGSVVRYDVADGTSQVQASVDSPIALAWDGAYLWVASRENDMVVQLDGTSGDRRQTIDVGDSPEALAWDGTSLWVANTADDTVMRINPEDGTVMDQVDVGDGPEALTWDGASMWVANLSEDSLTQIRLGPDTNVESTNTVPVGRGPRALAWAGGSLWVANVSDDTVLRLDPITGKTILTVPVGDSPVNLVADGTHIWVSNQQSNTVQRVNFKDYAILQTVSVLENPLAITWDGNHLWSVGNTGISKTGVIAKIDPATGERTASFSSGHNLFASTWDGSSLWVASRDEDSILEVDPATNSVVNTIEIGDSPKALLWDGTFLWVANTGDDTIMQLADGKIIATIPVGDAPENLSWDGTNIWTANQGDDTLAKVDPASGEVVQTFAVCDGPVALTWENSHLWTICWNDNTLMQIDPASGEVLATVPVGEYPSALLWDGISIWVANRGKDTGYQTVPDGTVMQIDPLTAQVVRSVQVGQAPFALTLVEDRLWVANQLDGMLMEINAHSLGLDLLARRQLSE